MSSEVEASTQTLDSSSDTIDLRLRLEPEMDPQSIEIFVDELTFRLVNEGIKQTTDPHPQTIGRNMCSVSWSYWVIIRSKQGSVQFEAQTYVR